MENTPRTILDLLMQSRADGSLGQDHALRYELRDGGFVTRTFPEASRHAAGVLLASFRAWVEQHGGQASLGVSVEVDSCQVLWADVAFLAPQRLDEPPLEVAAPAWPDLVADVTSPGTGRAELQRKRDLYEARTRVGEYWLVDLDDGVVLAHRRDPAGGYQVAEHTSGTLATPSAPGLEVSTAPLFAAG